MALKINTNAQGINIGASFVTDRDFKVSASGATFEMGTRRSDITGVLPKGTQMIVIRATTKEERAALGGHQFVAADPDGEEFGYHSAHLPTSGYSQQKQQRAAGLQQERIIKKGAEVVGTESDTPEVAALRKEYETKLAALKAAQHLALLKAQIAALEASMAPATETETEELESVPSDELNG